MSMEIQIAVLLLLVSTRGISSSMHQHRRHRERIADNAGYGVSPLKLFVFGDSYADTGNLAKIISPSWSEPYGITFPGRPAGRFSDGRVLTDYVASSLGIKTPIPYKYRRLSQKVVNVGMNFAIGGSGVFDNGFLKDNLTVQINTFKEQVTDGVFSYQSLKSSMALVSISGNDYVNYQDNGGTMEGLKMFTPKLISQLKMELKRLCDIGITNVAVTNLHPIGCTPYITNPDSNKMCNNSVNLAVSYHNVLLKGAVQELNRASNSTFTVVIIDLFSAFTSAMKQQGRSRFVDVLKPCCEAISNEYRCGYIDPNGMKKYTVCSQRESKFYWDSVHPTQAGWSAVFDSLRPSLHNIFN